MNEELIGIAVALAIAVVGWIYLSTAPADVFVNPITGQRESVALTRQYQIEIGEALSVDLENENGGASSDSRVSEISGVLFQMLRQLEIQGQFPRNDPRHLSGFPYRFQALNSSQSINAWALPGGRIYITRGLMNVIVAHANGDQRKIDAMIAAVIAHEIGHVALRHSAESVAASLKGAFALNLLERLLGAEQKVVLDASEKANALIQLKFSRILESEADHFGFRLLCISGYDSSGMAELLTALAALDTSTRPQILLSHPRPGERVRVVQGYSC